jgi:hypothetical protein
VSSRNNILGLIFLVAVLAFALFAAERLLFPTGSKRGAVAALLEKSKLPAKPLQPKPSAAVVAPPSPPAPSVAQPSTATPSSPQAQQTIPAATGPAVGSRKEQFPAANGPAIATEKHLPQLKLESGARLWIRVTSISRQPDGSFTFRGTLLQPVALPDAKQLDQGAELAGSGTLNNGHVTVLVREFSVGGTNYALLRDTGGSNRPPGTGLAVELDPGKLLEVWLASSSVYRRIP